MSDVYCSFYPAKEAGVCIALLYYHAKQWFLPAFCGKLVTSNYVYILVVTIHDLISSVSLSLHHPNKLLSTYTSSYLWKCVYIFVPYVSIHLMPLNVFVLISHLYDEQCANKFNLCLYVIYADSFQPIFGGGALKAFHWGGTHPIGTKDVVSVVLNDAVAWLFFVRCRVRYNTITMLGVLYLASLCRWNFLNELISST